MEKNFDKNKFNKNLIASIIFSAILLLIGILSFVFSSIKGASYYQNPKNYYGVYFGYDNNDTEIELIISEENAEMKYGEETGIFEYTYLSPERVKVDYGKEDGRAGVIIYTDKDANLGFLYWIYSDNERTYLMENISQYKLDYMGSVDT